jgi:hypothetical protein
MLLRWREYRKGERKGWGKIGYFANNILDTSAGNAISVESAKTVLQRREQGPRSRAGEAVWDLS